jgi:hypothetical protein
MLTTQTLVNNLTRAVINPLIALVFAVGLLVFVWGLIQFLWGQSQGDHSADEGKQHMLWGIIGMFVMAAAYAILRLVDSSVGSNIVP